MPQSAFTNPSLSRRCRGTWVSEPRPQGSATTRVLLRSDVRGTASSRSRLSSTSLIDRRWTPSALQMLRAVGPHPAIGGGDAPIGLHQSVLEQALQRDMGN